MLKQEKEGKQETMLLLMDTTQGDGEQVKCKILMCIMNLSRRIKGIAIFPNNSEQQPKSRSSLVVPGSPGGREVV